MPLKVPTLDLTGIGGGGVPTLDLPPAGGFVVDGVDLVAGDLTVEPIADRDDLNFEEAAKEELGETLSRMKAISVNATERFKNNTDTDYIVVVVFLNQVQKDAFMKASGWGDLSGGGRYVNGVALAHEMDIELPPVDYKPFEPKT